MTAPGYKCEECEKPFRKPAIKTEPPEYPGGRAWTFEQSPCCKAGFNVIKPCGHYKWETMPDGSCAVADCKGA